MSKNRIEFYNFTLTFGEDLVLLDLFDQVVYPAFFEVRERSIQSSTYFFLDTQLVNLSERSDSQDNIDRLSESDQQQEEVPKLAIIGRFVKDTNLTREQRFDYENQEIVPEEGTLQSSPTAVFVLILNTHRLLYFGETHYPPLIKTFEATVQKFLVLSHLEFLQRLYNEQPSDSKDYSALETQYPHPTLKITPLPNQDDLRSFLARYSKLETVEIQLSTTNAIDNEDFFNELRTRRRHVSAKNAFLKYQNKETGLNKDETIKETENLVSQADASMKFSGLDDNQNRLSGSLDLLKLIVPLNVSSSNVKEISRNIFLTYTQLIEQGRIAQARINKNLESINTKIVSIWENMVNNLDDDSEDDNDSPSA